MTAEKLAPSKRGGIDLVRRIRSIYSTQCPWALVRRSTTWEGTMQVLRIGIAPRDAIRAGATPVPKSGKRKPGDPDIWADSAYRIGKLIDNNWLLLQEIRRNPPPSITALAKRMGRPAANVTAAVKVLELRGLVSTEKGEGAGRRPVVTYDRIELLIAPFTDGA
jgi:predicted transcriptional regulator